MHGQRVLECAAIGRILSHLARNVGRSGLGAFVDLYMDGKIEIAPLISHEIALADVNRGFDMIRRGEALRSVIRFE